MCVFVHVVNVCVRARARARARVCVCGRKLARWPSCVHFFASIVCLISEEHKRHYLDKGSSVVFQINKMLLLDD